ncbi:YgiQ family radical SAM protein [Thiovibrio sp. JS02]
MPISAAEMRQRRWDYVDVVLVTGDAYVDHPSFGVALIGRLLESKGYRVAILSQPRHDNAEAFRQFGRPRLFFGITAGNLDSVVANYSGNAKVRDSDEYSPGGNPYFGAVAEKKMRRRPDRASILYTNLAKAAYPEVPVVLGGVEASLRRFVHYDYQQQRLRASILTDAKADLLVYGMGERAVIEVAAGLDGGFGLAGIAGTCERLTPRELSARRLVEPVVLPAWQEIQETPRLFLDAELAVDRQARAYSQRPVLQKQQAAWVLQHRPAAPLTSHELDALSALPFLRAPHPAMGEVPAFRMIKDSLTIVRGCCGNCSFCAITRHQGPIVISRSAESIVAEAKTIASQKGFSGTISDLGGPTANLYGSGCASPIPCKRHDCLYPELCRFFIINENAFLGLLEEVSRLGGVKHLFVSSGLRMELLLKTPALLKRILLEHTPGAMKIAPEHTEPEILRLMHKPGPAVLTEFLAKCREIARTHGKEVHFSPYFISAHPGCGLREMETLVARLRDLRLRVRQFQDFTPTPGTIATAMYVTGLDRENGKPLFVARTILERRRQRQVLEDGKKAGAEKGGAREKHATAAGLSGKGQRSQGKGRKGRR